MVRSERRMISHRLFERRLQTAESFIYGERIVAIECDHLFAGLTATDYFEGIRLDAVEEALATADADSREKPSSGPARFDFIIGVSVLPG